MTFVIIVRFIQDIKQFLNGSGLGRSSMHESYVLSDCWVDNWFELGCAYLRMINDLSTAIAFSGYSLFGCLLEIAMIPTERFNRRLSGYSRSCVVLYLVVTYSSRFGSWRLLIPSQKWGIVIWIDNTYIMLMAYWCSIVGIPDDVIRVREFLVGYYGPYNHDHNSRCCSDIGNRICLATLLGTVRGQVGAICVYNSLLVCLHITYFWLPSRHFFCNWTSRFVPLGRKCKHRISGILCSNSTSVQTALPTWLWFIEIYIAFLNMIDYVGIAASVYMDYRGNKMHRTNTFGLTLEVLRGTCMAITIYKMLIMG